MRRIQKHKRKLIKKVVIRLDLLLSGFGYTVVKKTAYKDTACQVDLDLEERIENEKNNKGRKQSLCKVEGCQVTLEVTPPELRLSFKDIVLSKLAQIKSPNLKRENNNGYLEKENSIDKAFDSYFAEKGNFS